MNTGRVTTIVCMLAVLFALSAGSTAFAQSTPAQSVYNPAGEVLGVTQGGGPADVVPSPGTANGTGTSPSTPSVTRETGAGTPATSTGSLPFTGFEAGLVALAGLALLGTGLAMRRVSRSNS
jgi:hypothetical protein